MGVENHEAPTLHNWSTNCGVQQERSHVIACTSTLTLHGFGCLFISFLRALCCLWAWCFRALGFRALRVVLVGLRVFLSCRIEVAVQRAARFEP